MQQYVVHQWMVFTASSRPVAYMMLVAKFSAESESTGRS